MSIAKILVEATSYNENIDGTFRVRTRVNDEYGYVYVLNYDVPDEDTVIKLVEKIKKAGEVNLDYWYAPGVNEAKLSAASPPKAPETSKSDWVGVVGKEAICVVTCIEKKEYKSQYNDSPGVLSILKDDKGNTLKTFGKCPVGEGETVKVSMRIKRHDEWKSMKSTVVNYMKRLD